MKVSSLLFFTAGVAVGAAGREAYPKLKESLGPLAAAALAGAENAIADAVEAAREVGKNAVANHVPGAHAAHAHNGATATHI